MILTVAIMFVILVLADVYLFLAINNIVSDDKCVTNIATATREDSWIPTIVMTINSASKKIVDRTTGSAGQRA